MMNSQLLSIVKPPVPAGNLTLCMYVWPQHKNSKHSGWLSTVTFSRVDDSSTLPPPPPPPLFSLSPFLLQTLSSRKENLLLAQFKWKLPSYRWILTFNILGPLLESVYPTFIMQYVLLSPCGPPSLHYEMFVLCFPKSQSCCQMER